MRIKVIRKQKEKELKRLARLIANVELGLSLLRNIAPSEPAIAKRSASAIAVKALLSGYRFPVSCLQNEDNWRKVKIARFYLIRLKGELWERSLDEYIQLPEELRIFELVDIMDGRTITVPLARYPRLLAATPEQREKWQICGWWLWYSLGRNR